MNVSYVKIGHACPDVELNLWLVRKLAFVRNYASLQFFLNGVEKV